jgi:hypothetical protein
VGGQKNQKEALFPLKNPTERPTTLHHHHRLVLTLCDNAPAVMKALACIVVADGIVGRSLTARKRQQREQIVGARGVERERYHCNFIERGRGGPDVLLESLDFTIWEQARNRIDHCDSFEDELDLNSAPKIA